MKINSTHQAVATWRVALLATLAFALPVVAATEENGLKDPTQPNWHGLSKAKKANSGPVLNSLVTGPQRRIAVINGVLMREGEKGRGFTLEQIMDDSVLVTTKSGKQRVLSLGRSSSFKKSADKKPSKGARR